MQYVDVIGRDMQVFDTALPQDWYDLAYDRTGENPSGHIVWCYDNSVFGYPRAIDAEGDRIVGLMAGALRPLPYGREP